MKAASLEIYTHLQHWLPTTAFLFPLPASSFHFAVQQSFTRKYFIGNPCLGIYSGLCHKLWQKRTSLLLHNSKYFSKVITIKSMTAFSCSRICVPAAARTDMRQTWRQRLPLMRRQSWGLERKRVFFSHWILHGSRIVFLQPRSASVGHGNGSQPD